MTDSADDLLGLTVHAFGQGEVTATSLGALARAAEAEPDALLMVLWNKGSARIDASDPAGGSIDAAMRDVMAALRGRRLPTVAVYDGVMVGLDLELALRLDIRVAAPSAVVGFPDLRLGRLPRSGAIRRLVDLVGESLAVRMSMLGEVFPADHAALERLHDVAPPGALEMHAGSLVERLRGAAPWALEAIRSAAELAAETPLSVGAMVEADLASLMLGTHDRLEGLAAHAEHRVPAFKGA